VRQGQKNRLDIVELAVRFRRRLEQRHGMGVREPLGRVRFHLRTKKNMKNNKKSVCHNIGWFNSCFWNQLSRIMNYYAKITAASRNMT